MDTFSLLQIIERSPELRFKYMGSYPSHQYLQLNLEREPNQYNYMETIARPFIIPSRQNQFIQEITFNNAPIRKIAVAVNKKSAVAGSFHENPFSYHQVHLRELTINRCERVIGSKEIQFLLVVLMLQQRKQCSLTKIFQFFLWKIFKITVYLFLT